MMKFTPLPDASQAIRSQWYGIFALLFITTYKYHMEKILLLADAHNFKAETLDFACYMANLGKSTLVGVFVEQSALAKAPSVKTIGGTAYVEEITVATADQQENDDLVKKGIATFKGGCIKRETVATVHHDKGDPLETIVTESRYADLLIVDPAFSFSDDGKVPSAFVMNILHKAECPVLIAPEYYEQTDEIVLAYDGSSSSVFAIKQFYYQLPKLADKRMVVLHINKEQGATLQTKEELQHFKEWLDMHFPKVSFLELTGNARDILFEYFLSGDNPNRMLVTGAFGRNYLSTFFKPGTAELVLKAVDLPIFVAHH